jgi:VWFA-related protein
VAGAQDHRSLVLFFDLNSMNAPDQLRAQENAIKFVEDRVAPSDLVSIMTFTAGLKVVQGFSNDNDALIAALHRIIPSADAVGGDGPLKALQSAATILAPTAGKKELIYFSNGIWRRGAEDQAHLKATVDAAVRANVAIYPMD